MIPIGGLAARLVALYGTGPRRENCNLHEVRLSPLAPAKGVAISLSSRGIVLSTAGVRAFPRLCMEVPSTASARQAYRRSEPRSDAVG